MSPCDTLRRREYFHLNRGWRHVVLLGLIALSACSSPEEKPRGAQNTLAALKYTPQANVFYLDNGMEVILMENDAHPMITAFTIVRTGSRNEDAALNGAAHFLEHLLFNGTRKRTQKQLYDEMDYYGGYNNAHTGPDFTNYMILMPREFIAEGMDMQADMLFNSTLPADKFEKERGIVIEEIGKDSNRPEYQADNFFQHMMFRGSPYERPVLGSVTTISNLSRERVWEYYKKWYVPNNMTLMVIGDFRTAEMLQIVREKYGPYPPQALPETPPISFKSPKHLQILRATGAGKFPQDRQFLRIGYLLPPPMAGEFQALELCADFLGGREDSRLKSFFKRKENSTLVNTISAQLEFNASFATLQINAELPATADADLVVQKILQQVARMATEPISETVLQGHLMARATGDIFLEEKLHYYGIMKAAHLAAGGYGFLRDYVNNLLQVTPAQMQQAAARFLVPQTPVVTLLAPQRRRPKEQTDGSVNRYGIRIQPNGLTAATHQNTGSRVVGIHLAALDRTLAEGKGKRGMAEILQRLLERGGTASHPGAELRRAFEAIGAEVKFYDSPEIPYDDYYQSPRFAYIRIKVVDSFFKPALALLAEVVKSAALPAVEFQQAKREVRSLAANALTSTPMVAERAFYDHLFADNPGFGWVIGDTLEVSSIQLAEVQKLYERFYNPANLQLTVSGNLPPDSVFAEIGRVLGDEWGETGWRARKPAFALNPFGKTFRTTVGKAQSFLYVANTFAAASDQAAALAVVMQIFSDRLAFELRERQGLAYALGASAESLNGSNWYRVRMGTRPENLARALNGIAAEIRRMSKGDIADAELEKTRNALLGREGMRRLDRVSQAYFIAMRVLDGAPPEADEAFATAIKAVQLAEARALAKTIFQTDNPLVIIAE